MGLTQPQKFGCLAEAGKTTHVKADILGSRFLSLLPLVERNYPVNHIMLNVPPNSTGAREAELNDEQTLETHANGTFNGTSAGSPRRQQASTAALDAVKVALRDTAIEFELRYSRAFSDLHSTLHITPATAYQSFENVMDEVFRDGVNWGRIVGLFAFGGALCVECVEKEMSHLVGRIVEWMTVYLDEQIDPWIQSQGGWAVSLLPSCERGFDSMTRLPSGSAFLTSRRERTSRLDALAERNVLH
ncbi:hypothetical protein GOODEAATRI_001970 [Goodea atripinnis]|uniref:Bcl-2 Bcl-2 homology region 1-3 domain-containing protein n=1 Tax=Goodea atripinnis TaxID=208336 RepID=A0ABV0NR42_9TELE